MGVRRKYIILYLILYVFIREVSTVDAQQFQGLTNGILTDKIVPQAIQPSHVECIYRFNLSHVL